MKRISSTLIVSLQLLAATVAGYGQPGRGELTGLVRDAGGGAVKAAEIVILRVGTHESIRIITGTDGGYTATGLRPGLYRVEVRSTGLLRVVREGLRLTTGERVRLDFDLEVGRVEAEVVIRSDASLLRSESSSLGQLIPHRSIVSLPLNGRNFFSLIALAPGVATPPPTAGGPSLPRLNGGRPRVNEFLYDGISALQPEPGQVAFYPVIEAIEEFKVENNLPAAEFGRFNGGVINLTTKSGSNELRGSGFGFLRNESLNARNLFAASGPFGSNRPLFRRRQYGMVVGGPIRSNRTFFFGDYQGTQQAIGRVLVSTVPTVAQRSGDFSASLGAALTLSPTLTVTNATTGNTGRPIEVIATNGERIPARAGQIFRPSDRLAYAGNLIPANEIDPVARLLLGLYPRPNAPGTGNNFRRLANEQMKQDQYDARIDHRVGSGGLAFGRVSATRETILPVTPLPDGGGAISQGTLGDQRVDGLQLAGSYQQSRGGNMLNELRGGYTSRSVDRRSARLSVPLLLPGLPIGTQFDRVLPTMIIAGIQQLGPSANTNTLFSTDVTQIVDTLSWQRGRHSVKVGIDGRLERLAILQPASPRGLFNFTAPFSGSRGTPNTLDGLPEGLTTGSLLAGMSGLSLASFLLGQVGEFNIDLQPRELRPRAKILEFFAQNDLRVSSRLTINAGLRYTLNFPSTESDDQGAIFNLQTQELEYAGRNGVPRSARRLERLNFGPRIGLAWRLGERMVVRTGYGLVWQEQAGITTPFTLPQFPFIQTVTQRSLDGVTPAFQLASGPTIRPLPLDARAGLGQGVFAVDRDLGSGYAQQWNLAIQRELSRNLALEVAYAGSKITRVGIPDSNINQLSAAQLALGSQLLQLVPNPFYGEIPRYSPLGDRAIPRAQLLRPFPRFTTVSLYRNNVGNTSYHALLVKLEKRVARGLSLLVSYTRSKLIDDAGSVFDASIQTGPVANYPVADSFNRRLERDVSTGDLPNALAVSSTIDLNFGRGMWLKRLRQGWQIAVTATVQSGLPFPVTQVTNFNAFAGYGVQRPNLLRTPALPAGARSTSRWFDTTAFAIAPQFTLGSSSRNPVRGPGYRHADFALIKLTPLGEKLELELRGEVFNLTNTPPLGNPNGVAGSPAFGTITSAGDPRVIQLGLKLHF